MAETTLKPVNVLVVFYSLYGAAERLALRAGVGAVQARANIRLRRLADIGGPSVFEQDGKLRPQHQQMLADYIAPRETDVEWADLFLVACPEVSAYDPSEVEQFLQNLANVKGKTAALITPKVALATAAASVGLRLVMAQPKEEPVDFGRRASEDVRARKSV
jgi:hypothetical protein